MCGCGIVGGDLCLGFLCACCFVRMCCLYFIGFLCCMCRARAICLRCLVWLLVGLVLGFELFGY